MYAGLVQDLKNKILELNDKFENIAAAETELKRTCRSNLFEILITAILNPRTPVVDHCSWDEIATALTNM
jgi:hypothetical protein